MEFRIAPLIMAVCLFVYLLFIHPAINTAMPLNTAAQFSKVLTPVALLLILSLSTFFRHTFLSARYKLIYWILQALNITLIVWYFLYLKEQHML